MVDCNISTSVHTNTLLCFYSTEATKTNNKIENIIKQKTQFTIATKL